VKTSASPHNDNEPTTTETTDDDPLVVYLVVRESLGMSPGKIAAQCAHAMRLLLTEFHRFPHVGTHFLTWLEGVAPRVVVLRADDKEWERLKGAAKCFVMRDAGHTEVAAGSETAMALWPMRKSERPATLRRLQAL
jgi:peptidyl-tRNA hydrolase, PTH2 family